MSPKKTAFAIAAPLLLLAAAATLLPDFLNSRNIPDDPVPLRQACLSQLYNKCAECHVYTDNEPDIKNFDALLKQQNENRQATLLEADIDQRALRQLDLAELGTDPRTNGTPRKPNLGKLEKLNEVFTYKKMPPDEYRITHWGSSLTEEDINLIQQWTEAERKAYLRQWGMEEYAHLPIQPLPQQINVHPQKAALGKLLFADKRISGNDSVACSKCHIMASGGTDNQAFSKGATGRPLWINTPTLFNTAFHARMYWEGLVETLKDHAISEPLDPESLNGGSWKHIISKLSRDEALVKQFKTIYPEGMTAENISDSLAEYEKSLITPNSKFDKFLRGNTSALNETEKAGYDLFRKYRCLSCHAGPAMGGHSFEYIDLKDDYFKTRNMNRGDIGYAQFTKKARDLKRFKTPTLRNIELTAPYMHDASCSHLEDAVRIMLQYSVGVKNIANREEYLLTQFLKTLTGEWEGKPLPFGEHTDQAN